MKTKTTRQELTLKTERVLGSMARSAMTPFESSYIRMTDIDGKRYDWFSEKLHNSQRNFGFSLGETIRVSAHVREATDVRGTFRYLSHVKVLSHQV